MSNSNFSPAINKKQALGKADKFNQSQGNSLKRERKQETKEYQLENGVFKASRVVVEAEKVASTTQPHPLNPRNQKALSQSAVAGTLESIRKKGITEDCLGIRSKDGKTILIIEGSVRRYSAIETDQPYPVWVLPAGSATSKDVRELINDAHNKKPHSLRERGKAYWAQLLDLGENPEALKIDEMSELLEVGRETIRKCMVARGLDARLLEVFPDYEGIPSGFYNKLAKVEKELTKHLIDISTFCDELRLELIGLESLSVKGGQEKVMTLLEHKKDTKTGRKITPTVWEMKELVEFSSKDKHARKSVSPNGRVVKFELSRQSKELIQEIEDLIKSKAE